MAFSISLEGWSTLDLSLAQYVVVVASSVSARIPIGDWEDRLPRRTSEICWHNSAYEACLLRQMHEILRIVCCDYETSLSSRLNALFKWELVSRQSDWSIVCPTKSIDCQSWHWIYQFLPDRSSVGSMSLNLRIVYECVYVFFLTTFLVFRFNIKEKKRKIQAHTLSLFHIHSQSQERFSLVHAETSRVKIIYESNAKRSRI